MIMAHQAALSEFIERARALCSTQCRNLRKEAENFFQLSRSQNTDNTFLVCIDILNHIVSSQNSPVLSPELLLASQTLCWICKHKSVPRPQMEAISEQLISLADQGYNSKYPLVVQITSAVSAALITNNMRIGSSGASWSEAVVGSMFTIAAERRISSKLWVTYILSILSTMPEVVASKEVILLVCASSDITQSVAADASFLKNLLVAGELLKQTSTVECTAIQAVVLSSSADAVDLLADAMGCCTQWVSFAAQILQIRLPAAPSSDSVVPTFLVALENVNLWHRSALVNTAISYLKSGGANAGAGTEACLEMCVALCNAVDLGENTTAAAVHPIEAHLCSLAQSIAMQLLPALSELLGMMCTRCNEALMAQNVQSTDATQVESAFEKCLLMTRTAAECATALLTRAYKPIFFHPGNTAVLSPELSAVVTVWVTFVNTFQETIYAFADLAQELVQNSTEPELVDIVSSQRQQLLEVGLSFISDLAEATYATQYEHIMDGRAALTNSVNRAVEKVLVAAVQASAYSIQERTKVGVDEFDEFRNHVRDCLRLLVVSVPSLALWLVNHTTQSISSLSHQVRTRNNANQCGELGGVHWFMTEALLHALTAITKHIQSHARSGPGADLLHAAFQLARLLTSDDVCSVCRPLSRMCVILYAELAPIFLEQLERLTVETITAGDQEVKILSVGQVLRAMMLRLLLSLYHPEAPFNPQRPLPACIAVVQSVPNSGIFLLESDRSGENLDFLSLEGSFVPFRVKQDHIGAVSLQKAFAAVLTHIVQHPHSRATLGAVLCPNLGLWNQLPNIVKLLKNTQQHVSEQNLSVCMLQGAFNISAANDSETKITPTLLCLSLSALISHNLQDTEELAMTYKSFQLQIQALNAGLLIPFNFADLTAQSVLHNVGAFSAPMSAAIAHILAHRRGDGDGLHVRAYVSHCCRLLRGSEDDACLHAVTELSQCLCTRCSLPQLFSILSGLIHEMRLTCAKVASSLASVYYGALLCVIETCVPLLELLVHAAREKSLALTDLETEALCDFLSACSCVEYSAVAVTAEPALYAVATSLLLRLQENYVSLLREATVGVKRQLLLPVALVVLKSVCTWSAAVNTTELFHRTVGEVSTIGVQITHEAAQQKSLPSQRNPGGSNGKTCAEHNHAFFILLQFWNVCLSRTVLLPAVVPATTPAAAKKGTKSLSEEVAKLSFDALGWDTLNCILAQVCRNFESFCLDPSAELLVNNFCHGHVDGWEAALKVLTLSLGPVNIAVNANASVLDSDGKITLAALKDAKCKEEPAGESELVNWLVQSGHAERINRALLYALLQSTSAPGASVSISSQTNEKQVRYFPSELRDDCIACLLKLVLCLGTARAGVSLNQALQHAQCPRNGVLGAQSASAAGKVCQWVEKLLAQGKAGDWKKFRSHAKTLCRG